MADGNILTDAEKLKKVVDMASQQNAKSYEATNPHELRKVIEEAPISSVIKVDEEEVIEKRPVKKQIQPKNQDIEILKEEMKELKEIMKLQMEIDKMRNNQKVYNPIDKKEVKVDSIVTKKPENMDDDGFIDMTKDIPKDAVKKNPLPASMGIITPQTAPLPIVDKDKKKVKIMNQGLKVTLFWVGAIIFTLILIIGLNKLLGLNYLISAIIGLVISIGIFSTIYLTKIKVPEHQMPRKETINYNNFEMAELKRCSLCGNKLIKSKVTQTGDEISQSIKCSNIHCNFQKTIRFDKENGY